MILKAVNQTIQFGFKYAVATVGWLIILVSTALAFAAPSVLPMGGTVHLVFLAIGALMAYLYNSPDKNVFVNFGLGLWDTYNMATGLLGDILSYVRLFALGLSGGILASVFNSLAVGMSPDNIIAGPIVMVLIFLIGHSINIFMNVLGAMVHPMRLTFVEFFKNADGVRAHMKKHAAILKPKFDIVLDRLNKELSGLGIADWFSPKGGYFISLDVLPGTAKRVGELCKAGGVTLTSVGATYPYGIDPQDSNIRIAPSFPPNEEMALAAELLCICTRLAAIEKLVG